MCRRLIHTSHTAASLNHHAWVVLHLCFLVANCTPSTADTSVKIGVNATGYRQIWLESMGRSGRWICLWLHQGKLLFGKSIQILFFLYWNYHVFELEIQYLITVLKHWSRERDIDGTYECKQNVGNFKFVNMEFLELINYSTNIYWSCPYIMVLGCFFVGWFVCFFNFSEEGLSLL